MMVQEQLEYKLNWERIFGKKTHRGMIFYIPSEAVATIVQYDPDFKISALIPPATRPIGVDYKGYLMSRTHESPFLILSHLKYNRNSDLYSYYEKPSLEMEMSLKHFPWCHCQICTQIIVQLKTFNLYYLYAVSTQTDKEIMAQPYRLNNVYGDAKCCFKKGSGNHLNPKNLKQAHVRFWMDHFSDEFMLSPLVHKCDTRSHIFSYRHMDCLDINAPCFCNCCLSACGCPCACYLGEIFANFIANYKPSPEKWENYTRVICGNQFVSFSKKIEAVFISSDPELIQTVPTNFLKQSPQFPEQFLIGFANQQENQWEIDLLDQKLTLNASQVVVA